jgi:mannose-6-phosphate isomerase-like protein (cupin superfamily)
MKINKYQGGIVMIEKLELEKINLQEITKDIKDQHVNFAVSNINNHCLRIAVFSGEYKWHYHSNSDELFMVLEGELLIDFKDKDTAVLKPNDTLLIPAGTIHRTRAKQRTVNLCFEDINADTIIIDE